mgnify:CR=1 FL=1
MRSRKIIAMVMTFLMMLSLLPSLVFAAAAPEGELGGQLKIKGTAAVGSELSADYEKVTPEGLCIKCARELNIGSINQMIDKLGISDEEIEAASEQMANLMENMGDFDMDSLGEMFNPENFDGAQTMPFSDLINGALSTNDEVDNDELANQVKDSSGKKRKRGKKNGKDDSRKFLNTYCTLSLIHI